MYKELKKFTNENEFIKSLLEHKPKEYTVVYESNGPLKCRIELTIETYRQTNYSENRIEIIKTWFPYNGCDSIIIRYRDVHFMTYTHNGKQYIYECELNSI